MTGTTTTTVESAQQADDALAKLQGIVQQLDDGDLHRAHRDGGWTVAQVVSHINVCTLIWLGDLMRLQHDPELSFIFREEVGHDAKGYPPPTVELATQQLSSTRRSLATCVPATPEEVLDRTVEIPDLGTMTVREWTPLIIGHVISHVDHATEILTDRDAMPTGA